MNDKEEIHALTQAVRELSQNIKELEGVVNLIYDFFDKHAPTEEGVRRLSDAIKMLMDTMIIAYNLWTPNGLNTNKEVK